MNSTLKIVYVSSFPPRECGIATFSADLTNAMNELLGPAIEPRIAAVNIDAESRHHYPREVIFQFDSSSEADYIQTAEKINARPDVKLVNIQHEFGLFGGAQSTRIVSFLKTLKKPSIVTFHTVLPEPDEALREIVRAIAEHSNGVLTMTSLSKQLLTGPYGIPQEKISVVPHGIHSVPYSSSSKAKMTLGLSKKITLLTFGLLSRGKGIEYVLDALPQIVRVYPDFVYIVLGVTHPVVLKEEGESYRNFLIQKVRDLKLSAHVNFYNQYVPLEKLLQFIRASDIYISTSLNPNQTVSGTLSYALGCGRPVISTPFAQAKEIITPESGLLVRFRDPDSYAESILTFLKDPVLREQAGKNAYFRTRNMTWENVAVEYSKLFSKHCAEIAEVAKYKKIPRMNVNHLFHLTDDFGVIQFAKLSVPDLSSGYTVDDNARALIVACACHEHFDKLFKYHVPDKKKTDLLEHVEIYLRFIESVLDENGTFHNYVRSDRTLAGDLNKNENLDDANGRALWALGIAATTGSLPKSVRAKAFALFEKSIERFGKFESPRATAFLVKGISGLLKKTSAAGGRDLKELLITLCDRLVSLYRSVSSEEWQWFENYLTYSNAVLAEALLLGHRRTGNTDFLETGLKTLDFLIAQTFSDNVYVPIGQKGWLMKAGTRYYYDQQPEDVSAMTCALATAHAVTGKKDYKKLMHVTFNWFLGDNSLKQVVYDRSTGGCFDGVGEGHINLNQGSESTSSYLLARLALM